MAPALLAIIGLVFAYGQVSQANGLLESTARDAARTATQLRSRAEAEREITRIVREGVRSVPGCRDTVSATLEGAYVAGGYVTVKVTCSYPLSDVMFAGAPGRMNPRVEFISALDPYKGITP